MLERLECFQLQARLRELDDLFTIKMELQRSLAGGMDAALTADELKEKMRLLLDESVSTGSLEKTLEKIKPKLESQAIAPDPNSPSEACGVWQLLFS